MRKYLFFVLTCMSLHLCGAEKQEPFIILSIDGGGIRGVIPAHIISLFEKKWGVKSAQVFDSFAGTSTGGIIAIGLNVPHTDYADKPRYWADDIKKLYVEKGSSFFVNSWTHWLTTVDGLMGPKYDIDMLKELLVDMMGTVTLDKVVKDLVVTSFDATTHRHFLFENINQKTIHNSNLVDVALSTSAAPSYFPSHQVMKQNLVDGGVLANNPALWAYFEALKKSPQARTREVYVFSIGTGKFPEAPDTNQNDGVIASITPVIDDLFDGSDDTVEEAFSALAIKDGVHYIRWEPLLTKTSQQSMDNASAENIQELLDIAEDYFNNAISSKKFAPLKAILEERAQAVSSTEQ